jgi:RND family efflux transporter MFP subunit
MMCRLALLPLLGLWLITSAHAAELVIAPIDKVERKAVFGRVESRDTVMARARIGGTVQALNVEEGTAVKAGDVIATVVDDKLVLQLKAIDARIQAVDAQLQNALVELQRAQKLLSTGAAPKSRVDAQQTQVSVLTNQLAEARAEREVLVQQGTEGEVMAPAPGRVLAVPVTKGSVILPGETVARIAGGGYFLRLSLPERHAANIVEGDEVLVGERGLMPIAASARKGRLVKVYPEISDGHVIADVNVDGLGDFFVGERTLVWIPVETRKVIAVPPAAVSNRFGVDYVRLAGSDGAVDVPVIIGETFDAAGGTQVEILSGLKAGDTVVVP